MNFRLKESDMFRRLTIILATALAAHAATGSTPVPRAASPATGWSAGVDFGVASPLHNGAFFPQLRPTFGLNAMKQLSPVLSLGAEGWWGVNTSGWKGMAHSCTAFDNSYVGAVGNIDLIGLFAGYRCTPRPFSTALSAGAGWGHLYRHRLHDHNYFAAKVGLLFSVRLNKALALRLQPAILWNLSDSPTSNSSASFNARRALFHMQAGLSYSFGALTECILPYDQAQIDGLNGQVNDLRQRLKRASAEATVARTRGERLQAEFDACRAKPAVVREVAVNNRLNTVLDVFFHLGSAAITGDQMTNVERIAAYLNSHPGSHVVIKGYASRDGNADYNRRLAERRALAVKTALEKRYGISPDRISAHGAGIGELFDVESWNRVSVCTLEN